MNLRVSISQRLIVLSMIFLMTSLSGCSTTSSGFGFGMKGSQRPSVETVILFEPAVVSIPLLTPLVTNAPITVKVSLPFIVLSSLVVVPDVMVKSSAITAVVKTKLPSADAPSRKTLRDLWFNVFNRYMLFPCGRIRANTVKLEMGTGHHRRPLLLSSGAEHNKNTRYYF